MLRKRLILTTVLTGLMLVAAAMAQEGKPAPSQEMEMPTFGPPEEMKALAPMVGTWHYAGEMRMGPESDWMPHEATTVFSYVAGGAALQMEFTGPMMGMTMYGVGLNSFDRETGLWQGTWVDNFAGRLSLYTGTFEDGRLSLSGTDLMGGKEIFSRQTSFNITDSTFEWMMENSDDGKVWYISMRGTYTKQ
jgi:hypothetical protein